MKKKNYPDFFPLKICRRYRNLRRKHILKNVDFLKSGQFGRRKFIKWKNREVLIIYFFRFSIED